MRRLSRIALSLFGAVFLMLPATVSAADNPGTTATDYQPTTNNPQNDVSSGLQNTQTGLQPVSGQASTDQSALSGRSDLRVIGTTGGSNPNVTSIPPADDSTSGIPLWVYIPGLIGIGLGIIYLLRGRKGTKPASTTPVEKVAVVTPEPLPVPKKTTSKKHNKKKTSKNRKSKR